MTLRETMARHARTVLTRPDHFGEVWTYHPVASSGLPPVSVRVTVDRLGKVDSEGLSSSSGTLTARVFIPRSATWEGGIPYRRDGDQMEGPMSLGEDPVMVRVKRTLEEDESSLTIEIIE